MDHTERAVLAQRWWQALAVGTTVPLPGEQGRMFLSGLIDDLFTQMHADPFDPSRAQEIGAALVDARFTDPAVPMTSASVLCCLAGCTDRADAHARLAALLVALAQGHHARMCRARNADGLPEQPPALGGDDDRYRVLFENAVVAIAVGDTDGTVLEANRSLANMIGIPVGELRGTSIYDLAHAVERAGIRSRVHDELIPGTVGSILVDRRLVGADQSVRWLSFAITYVPGAGGHPDYLLVFGGDDTQRRLLQQKLHHQAGHDSLTGLPNRRHLLERIEQLLGTADGADQIGLCFADLDRFKQINDRFGHRAGDKILTEIAARLRAVAHEQNCVIARIGGDEFVALIPPPVDPDRLHTVANRLLSEVTAPISLDTRQLHVSASIGAILTPVAGANAETLFDAADSSLYSAKATERGNLVLRSLHTVSTGDSSDDTAGSHAGQGEPGSSRSD